MHLTRTRISFLAALAALAALLVAPAPAPAAAQCWQVLLNDWYDGTIDNEYAPACYREALKHLPKDAKHYSSAHADITRALQGVLAGTGPGGGDGDGDGDGGETPTTTDDGDGDGGGTNGDDGDDSGGGGGGNNGDDGGATGAVGGEPKDEKGLFGSLLDKLGPSNAESIPIPLLILAILGILLLAAGIAGVVARRLQARRVPVRPGPRPGSRR